MVDNFFVSRNRVAPPPSETQNRFSEAPDWQLDNALVAQKDRLLGLVNDGKFEQAFDGLQLVARLWFLAGYGYKAREVASRLTGAARHAAWRAEEAARGAKGGRRQAAAAAARRLHALADLVRVVGAADDFGGHRPEGCRG